MGGCPLDTARSPSPLGVSVSRWSRCDATSALLALRVVRSRSAGGGRGGGAEVAELPGAAAPAAKGTN